MSLIAITLWTYFVAWICSALLHVVDADVGSVRALGTPSVLLSVSVVAAIILVPALVCRAAFRRGRWRLYLPTVLGFGLCMGAVVALLGTGAPGAAARLSALLGTTLVCGLFLAAASLPTVRWAARGDE